MPARAIRSSIVKYAQEDTAGRARVILRKLIRRFPDADMELSVPQGDPWRLLVAVVLSAQCTDVKVNAATPGLFARFPDLEAFAQARPSQVVPHIRSLGLAPTKARRLVEAARVIKRDHGGKVPQSREALQALPGVGRKSASVILANAFRVPALAVDTHVGRVARRLGLTEARDPTKVELQLEALWPRSAWHRAHHTLIWHGRRICAARRPRCDDCPVEEECPRVGVEPSPSN